MGFLWLLIQNYHILYESEEVIGYWVCMCACVCAHCVLRGYLWWEALSLWHLINKWLRQGGRPGITDLIGLRIGKTLLHAHTSTHTLTVQMHAHTQDRSVRLWLCGHRMANIQNTLCTPLCSAWAHTHTPAARCYHTAALMRRDQMYDGDADDDDDDDDDASSSDRRWTGGQLFNISSWMPQKEAASGRVCDFWATF